MSKINTEKAFENTYQELLTKLSDLIENSRRIANHSVTEIIDKTCSQFDIQAPIISDDPFRNPFALKFLGLKNEFNSKTLKECYLIFLEDFFLKNRFSTVSRQKEFQIDKKTYCVDLVLFNRRLRCLVIIDLKLGKLTHADVGQMLLYTDYADKHWREEDENPPVGLILCDENNEALAHYTLDNLPNKILASQYKMILPDEQVLIEEIRQAKREIGKIRN